MAMLAMLATRPLTPIKAARPERGNTGRFRRSGRKPWDRVPIVAWYSQTRAKDSFPSPQSARLPARRKTNAWFAGGFHRPGRRRDHQPSRLVDRAVARHGERGNVPRHRPLASTSSLLDSRLVGEVHYRTAQEVRKTIAHY